MKEYALLTARAPIDMAGITANLNEAAKVGYRVISVLFVDIAIIYTMERDAPEAPDYSTEAEQ